MTRCLVLTVLLAACGGGGDAKPTPYVHADPAFALDAPAGFTPTEHDGAVELRGKGAAMTVMVSWERGAAAPAAARDQAKQILQATSAKMKIVAEGDLAGGGLWMETDYLDGTVEAWLPAGDVVVECLGSTGGAHGGRGPVLAACKTLRPAP